MKTTLLCSIALLAVSAQAQDHHDQDHARDLAGSVSVFGTERRSLNDVSDARIDRGSTIVTDSYSVPNIWGQALGEKDAHTHRTVTRIQPEGMPLPLPPLFGLPIYPNSGSTIVTDSYSVPNIWGQALGEKDAHTHRTVTRIQPEGMPLPLPPLFGLPIYPNR